MIKIGHNYYSVQLFCRGDYWLFLSTIWKVHELVSLIRQKSVHLIGSDIYGKHGYSRVFNWVFILAHRSTELS